jgi:hypothetical protein
LAEHSIDVSGCEAEFMLYLLPSRLRCWQKGRFDLVDDRVDNEVVFHCRIEIRQGSELIRLAIASDKEENPFARGEGA